MVKFPLPLFMYVNAVNNTRLMGEADNDDADVIEYLKLNLADQPGILYIVYARLIEILRNVALQRGSSCEQLIWNSGKENC